MYPSIKNLTMSSTVEPLACNLRDAAVSRRHVGGQCYYNLVAVKIFFFYIIYYNIIIIKVSLWLNYSENGDVSESGI